MKRKLYMCFFAIISCFELSLFTSEVNCAETNPYIVESVEFVFFDNKGQIITTKTTDDGVLHSIGSKAGAIVLPERIDADIALLSNKYGVADFAIKKSIKGNGYRLVFLIYEYAVVSDIKIVGATYTHKKEIQKLVDEKIGHKLSPTDVYNLEKAIKTYYLNLGYSEVAVSSSTDQNEQGVICMLINVEEGSRNFIKQVSITGLQPGVEYGHIISCVKARAYRALLPSSKSVGIPHTRLIEEDKMNILSALRNLGYQDASVMHEIIHENDGCIVLYHINKGHLYKIKRITFANNQLIEDNKINSIIQKFENKGFSTDTTRQIVGEISELYFNMGFIKSEIIPEISRIADTNEIKIHFQINEGCQYKIGTITPVNLKRTSNWLIFRTITLIPGKTITAKDIRDSHIALARTGWFSKINIVPEVTSDMDGVCDIKIHLEEKSFGDVKFSLGFPGYKLDLGLNIPNFRLLGVIDAISTQTLSKSQFVGHGEYLAISLSTSSRYRLSTSWQKPWFLGSRFKVGINLLSEAPTFLELYNFTNISQNNNKRIGISVERDFLINFKLFNEFHLDMSNFIREMIICGIKFNNNPLPLKPGLPVAGWDAMLRLQTSYIYDQDLYTMSLLFQAQHFLSFIDDLLTLRSTIKTITAIPLFQELDKYQIGGSSSPKSGDVIVRGLRPNYMLLENSRSTYACSIAIISAELVFMPQSIIRPMLFLDICGASTKPLFQNIANAIPIFGVPTNIEKTAEPTISKLITREAAFVITAGGLIEAEMNGMSIQMGVGYPIYVNDSFVHTDFEQIIFSIGASLGI